MNKKEYLKPAMRMVELLQRTMILAVSQDSNGMNRNLQSEQVDEAW